MTVWLFKVMNVAALTSALIQGRNCIIPCFFFSTRHCTHSIIWNCSVQLYGAVVSGYEYNTGWREPALTFPFHLLLSERLSWPNILLILSHLVVPVCIMEQACKNKVCCWSTQHDFHGAQSPLPLCTLAPPLFGTCSPNQGLTQVQTCKHPPSVDTSGHAGSG